MSTLRAAALVAMGLAGLVLVVGAHPRLRRRSLASRLHPYLHSLVPGRSGLLHDAPADGAFATVVRGLLEELGRRLPLPGGGGGRSLPLADRLVAAGLSDSPSDFRARQVGWSLGTGFAVLALAVVSAATGREVRPVPALVAAAVTATGVVLVVDRRLDRAIERRRARARVELPTVADLVCLCVTAGESLRGALAVVADAGSGPVATELRGALGSARAGQPLATALPERARRLGLPELERFVTSVLAAHERGVPLADALRGLAAELRAAQRREVVEAAGRKQVTMLIPVIALVLPVAVVFAFFPGVVAIRVLAG